MARKQPRNTIDAQTQRATRKARARAVRALERSAREARGDEYASEPDKERRLSAEELRGLSEYQYRSAAGADPEDLDETSPLPPSPAGAPLGKDDLTLRPEELTQHFLEEAVQEARPISPPELSAEESALLTPAQQRERSAEPRKPNPKLQATFGVDDGSEFERERSRFAREVAHARHEVEEEQKKRR